MEYEIGPDAWTRVDLPHQPPIEIKAPAPGLLSVDDQGRIGFRPAKPILIGSRAGDSAVMLEFRALDQAEPGPAD